MGGVALDRPDKVRDQIVPALQLDVDLAVCVLITVAKGNQAVVDDNTRHHCHHDDSENYKQCDHVSYLLKEMRCDKKLL